MTVLLAEAELKCIVEPTLHSSRPAMGAAVAAVVLRKEREIVDVYRRAGATNPGAARSLEELQLEPGFIPNRLVRSAVLRETSDTRYYLDEPTWHAMRIRRHRMLFVVLGLILLFMVVVGLGIIPTSIIGPTSR
jgi:hypothetical protein